MYYIIVLSSFIKIICLFENDYEVSELIFLKRFVYT